MIRVHRVKLHNFMSVADADLSFGDGKATMIVGENGSGKSTVLCAIGFAFDSYKKGNKYSDYVKKGETMASVYIESEVSGIPLIFDITINDDSSLSREVTYGNEDPCVNSACDALIQRLDLGYFAKVIFSMQDECDITKIGASARAQLLSRLLNFDFSQQSKEIADEIKALEAKQAENKAGIQANQDLIEDKKGKFEKVGERPIQEDAIAAYRTELEELLRKVADYDDKTEENVKITSAIEGVRAGLAPLDEKRRQVEESIRSATSAIDEIDRNEKAYGDSKATLEAAIATAKSEFDALSLEVSSKAEEASAAESATKDASAAVAAKNKEIVAKTMEESLLRAEAQSAKKDLAFMQQGSCPTCGKDIDQSKVPALQEAISKVEETIVQVVSSKAELQRELASLEATEAAARKTHTSVHGLLKAAESSRDHASQAESTNRQKLEGLKKPSPAASRESLAKSVADLTGELSTVNDSVAGIKAEIDALEKTRHQLNRGDKVQWKSRESAIQADLDRNAAWVQTALDVEKTNARLNDEIAQCEAKVSELIDVNAKLALEIADNAEARKVLDKDLPQYLIMKTCDSLEARINKFIQSVFPEMTIKMYQDKKGVDFFYVPTSDYETDPEDKDSWIHISMSSGMEKAALSTAWRVALAESYGLDILMLDECDAAATPRSSERLLTAVVDSPDFSQVFIVTHRKETRDALMASKDITVYYAAKGAFYDFDPEETETGSGGE